MFDEATGLLAGAIVATAFGYFSVGRLALPDLPLAFFITLSILAALSGTVDDDPRASRWLLIAGVAAGLGFLTKGPVALVVAGLVLIPIWLLERARFRLTVTQALVVVAVALAIGAPWYVAMTLAHGKAYLDSFFIGDNVERFATSRYNDPRPLWFYLPIVAGGMLPWTPVAAAALPRLWILDAHRASARRERRCDCWIWAFLPLLFFTASIGKQPRYILPILPPLALLLAREVRERLRTRSGRDWWLQGATAICPRAAPRGNGRAALSRASDRRDGAIGVRAGVCRRDRVERRDRAGGRPGEKRPCRAAGDRTGWLRSR